MTVRFGYEQQSKESGRWRGGLEVVVVTSLSRAKCNKTMANVGYMALIYPEKVLKLVCNLVFTSFQLF